MVFFEKSFFLFSGKTKKEINPPFLSSLGMLGNPSLTRRLTLAATAAATAELITFPIDTAKVHLQLMKKKLAPFPLRNMNFDINSRNYLNSVMDIHGRYGLKGFYSGWAPALFRAGLNNAMSATLYKPVRSFFGSDSRECSLSLKIASGFTTGSVTQIIAAPSDFIKVRLQADSLRTERRYSGVVDAIQKLYKNHGIKSFWTGLIPSMLRAGCSVAATLGTYDHCKYLTLDRFPNVKDNWKLHGFCSSISGFVASLVSCPFDVIKTRCQSQSIANPIYRGPKDCLKKIVKEEGIRALFKGFVPTYLRLGPWQLTFFMVYEFLNKKITGETF